jgi:hypothetical protein
VPQDRGQAGATTGRFHVLVATRTSTRSCQKDASLTVQRRRSCSMKWHDLDRPCRRDGANGSRSALRELFNYAHVIPIFERGDAPGSWRSRRGGWCPTATSRGVRNTASSGPSVESHPYRFADEATRIADPGGHETVVIEPCRPRRSAVPDLLQDRLDLAGCLGYVRNELEEGVRGVTRTTGIGGSSEASLLRTSGTLRRLPTHRLFCAVIHRRRRAAPRQGRADGQTCARDRTCAGPSHRQWPSARTPSACRRTRWPFRTA